MHSHHNTPVTEYAEAPLCINYKGTVFHRLGGKCMTYISEYHKDIKDFWLLASLYYNAERDLVIEYTCDGHTTESNFQKLFYKKLFKELDKNSVVTYFKSYEYYNFYQIRYSNLVKTMVCNRLKFLNLKNKKYHKKGYDVLRFNNAEDYAQFKLYFSDYFISS